MSEKFYDDEIAPAIQEIARKCKEHGMPFLAAVQFDTGTPNEGVGKTMCGIDDSLGEDMALTYLAMRARGNFDSFAINFARKYRDNSSMILRAIRPLGEL
jgi:hypothetical protein